MNTIDAKDQRIAELETELEAARRRYDELRADHDETLREHDRHIEKLKASHEKGHDIVSSLIEQIEECDAQIERWIEAFDMVLNDKGQYVWEDGLIQERDKWFNQYRELLADWNRFVPEYNAKVVPTASQRNMGRPLAAGPGQVDRIKIYRRKGHSLRWIADKMNLGLQTVRTVLDKSDGVDRATLKRLERIAPDKFAEARTKRSRREIAPLYPSASTPT
jgi:predicted RNase H-like nuclease (RuvC/YqgF family)